MLVSTYSSQNRIVLFLFLVLFFFCCLIILPVEKNEYRSVSIEPPPSALADIYNFISKDFESTDIFRIQSRCSRSSWFQYCFTTGLQ